VELADRSCEKTFGLKTVSLLGKNKREGVGSKGLRIKN